MDFRFTAEQEAFRVEVRSFLEETLTPAFWAHHAAHRLPGWSPEFSKAAAARGWLGIAWPKRYGGQGRGTIEQMIYMEEMARAGAPQEHHRRAIQQVGHSIMLFGNDEQKAQYLPGITSADISFAMGLSEPDAGSDLANVQTRAVRDGDEYVITGQKRFTSGAHYSDYLWTVARTDPDAPKHRGISMIIVPLTAPGVTVRPLIDPQGHHHFNEVYLEGVRVPVSNRVGEENRGWYVNAATMDFERSGIARIASLQRLLDSVIEAMRAAPAWQRHAAGHAVARGQLAEMAVTVRTVTLLAYRVGWLQAAGKVPNHEVSIVKNLAAETHQRIINFAVNYHGLAGLLVPAGAAPGTAARGGDDAEGGTSGWGPAYVAAIPATIAQGSSEINRTVVATRGLGLPRG